MSAHTKGPWALCAHLRDNDQCSCGYRGGIFGSDGDHMVCEMGSTVHPGEEGLEAPRYDRATEIANSHLIAAAPDMFEALKPFAEAVENLLDGHPDGSHIWESPAAMSLTAGDLRRALAALTKAQGLSPERELPSDRAFSELHADGEGA